MVDGGNMRDESVVVNSTNVFAALGSLRQKKKSSNKEQDSSKSKDKKGVASSKKESAKEVFWAPTPLTVKSWADVDDEDDEDYYATTAPPASVWAHRPQGYRQGYSSRASCGGSQESESEEEGLDEVDDDIEEEHDDEPKAPAELEPLVKKPAEPPLVHKDTDRQLSKKELKKKKLEELEAVLAELGLQKENGQDESHEAGTTQNKKANDEGDMETKENPSSEPKSSKKKEKKRINQRDPRARTRAKI
ncbi:DNA ligase 1-like [Tripterygium wilfordii]|uniref:DNA ligase 1-like n=1 Tax=Tripterygium wilfordii TaxID=458696 RepID=A0A7J7DQM9_TRIWF|nr:DNA ligase 1-like [Tripterygium wilfordii]